MKNASVKSIYNWVIAVMESAANVSSTKKPQDRQEDYEQIFFLKVYRMPAEDISFSDEDEEGTLR